MRIGIDASRAFLQRRTGIEEYSYQVIQKLRDELKDVSVTLYVRKRISFRNGRPQLVLPEIDFDLPPNWRVKGIWAPRFWTQLGLSFEMLVHGPDRLFIPAHTVPLIHPKKTTVTVHGLEYEFSPESYSFLERWYMRWSIRFSVVAVDRVIAVSENTKRDLMRLYGVPEAKIRVIYEGYDASSESGTGQSEVAAMQPSKPYFFFVGRIETRKNIVRMIEAFEIFKEKTGSTHELRLAGKSGYGYEAIRERIQASRYRADICEMGYVSDTEKWKWLRGADAFLFPSLYEGFGLPVIEAQSVGVPVITSNTSSLLEIAGDGALFVDPMSSLALAEAMEMLVRNPEKRADIIGKATRNADRFSWAHCAREVAQALSILKSSSPS